MLKKQKNVLLITFMSIALVACASKGTIETANQDKAEMRLPASISSFNADGRAVTCFEIVKLDVEKAGESGAYILHVPKEDGFPIMKSYHAVGGIPLNIETHDFFRTNQQKRACALGTVVATGASGYSALVQWKYLFYVYKIWLEK